MILKKLFYLLKTSNQDNIKILFVIIFINALIETFSVASILPFVSVISNPNIIETNYIINKLFLASNKFGILGQYDFVIFLGFFVFFILIISLFIKGLTAYLIIKFTNFAEYNLSRLLIERYLSQNYSWFLNNHSAELGKTILSEVQHIAIYGILSILALFEKTIIATFLIILLLVVDFELALITGLSIGSIYLLIFIVIYKKIGIVGKDRLNNNEIRFTKISEAFNATKEVKFGGLEKIYVNLFSTAAKIYHQSQIYFKLLSNLPRFFLEAIIFGGILLLIIFKTLGTGNINNSLPYLSLYIFAGYRLIPALQQIYSSISSLNFIKSSIEKIYFELKTLKLNNLKQTSKSFSFKKNIFLKDINYTYPKSSKQTLKNLNLKIDANSIVGIIGPTGGGKTTILDIILGLIEPNKGYLKIDGKILKKKNLKNWQKLIGYVPQFIYLSDDTIASNIAFGISPKEIDLNKVKKAAKIAKLDKFINNELPKKYQTIIGERGGKLSGGQRQRLGIARALYNNPKILILDEATSSLDSQTEKAIMNSLKIKKKDMTIIMSTHRLNTIKNCNVVYKIDNGKIIDKKI